MSKAFIFGVGGGGAVKPEQTKTVELSMASGNQEVSPDTGKVLTRVTVTKPATLIPDNIRKDITIGGVTGTYAGGSATLPTLRTVSISRNGHTLTISNPSTNGNFVSGYKIYSNGTLVKTQTTTTFDLDTLDVGVHSITVRAYGTNFNDSNASSAISYSIYSITNVLTDLTTSNSAVKIGMTQAYDATLTAASGKHIPDTITVTMGGKTASFSYNNLTGAISISSVTGNVVITATAEAQAKLAAPVIDLTGAILSWTTVAYATAYSIRCAGVEVATSTEASIDLSTLFTDDGAYAMTVVATASGYRESNPSNSKIYLIGVAPIYGVSWINDSTKTMTRTDNAVNLSYAINSSSGAITSDFNEVFPWNETIVETINGNKFLKFPEMWFRVGKDANNRITDVAVSKQQGPTGNWYKVDPFYYGCYGASSDGSTLKSVTGVTRLYTQTRATFRARAAATGAGYQQLDLYHKIVTLFLWWIEWATKDSASIMTGKTSATGSSRCSTGGTDAVTTPSGFNTSTKQMRYHYIEDFVGNFLEFIDGAVFSTNLYVTADASKFSDSATNHNLSGIARTGSGSNCIAVGWDENNPFLCWAAVVDNNSSYNTGFCDAWNSSNTTSPVVYSGAPWNGSGASYGVAFFYRRSASISVSDIGGRLLYKP